MPVLNVSNHDTLCSILLGWVQSVLHRPQHYLIPSPNVIQLCSLGLKHKRNKLSWIEAIQYKGTRFVYNNYNPWGYFLQNCMWMCLSNLENLTFSVPIFRPITHPSVYLF